MAFAAEAVKAKKLARLLVCFKLNNQQCQIKYTAELKFSLSYLDVFYTCRFVFMATQRIKLTFKLT